MAKSNSAQRILNECTELVPIDSLQPHPESVNEGDLGAVIQTVGALGFYGSVIVQSSTRRILAGRHRWLAAKDRGYTEIPATSVDVDDDKARRIMLADNRTCRLGADSSAALADLLQGILADTNTLVGTGYDNDALDELLADLHAKQIGLDQKTPIICPKCGHEFSLYAAA